MEPSNESLLHRLNAFGVGFPVRGVIMDVFHVEVIADDQWNVQMYATKIKQALRQTGLQVDKESELEYTDGMVKVILTFSKQESPGEKWRKEEKPGIGYVEESEEIKHGRRNND